MKVIQGWLPEAQQKRAESECGRTVGYMEEFTTAFGHGDDGPWPQKNDNYFFFTGKRK